MKIEALQPSLWSIERRLFLSYRDSATPASYMIVSVEWFDGFERLIRPENDI